METEANSKNKSDSEGEGKDSPLKRRTTRSQTHVPAVEGAAPSASCTPSLSASLMEAQARAILQQPSQTLVVDRSRLEALLDRTVTCTRGFNIEKCERLYSIMSQCVFHHRRDYDKTQLTQDLEKTLDRFIRH